MAALTLLVGLLAPGVGELLLGRFLAGVNRETRIGLGGLFGLATLGFLVLPIGLLGGLKVGVWVALAVGLAGAIGWPRLLKIEERGEAKSLLWTLPALLLAFLGAAVPATSVEWDSLAYHLAMPKLWLASGKLTSVDFVHHSNFPLTVDGLFVWGMGWGGEAGAKLFSPFFLLWGAVAIAGLAARCGPKASAIAAATFASVPMVVWLSGTAYIDVAHGLFAGLALVLIGLYLVGEIGWVPAALCLGFAAGSKYTGLQTIFVVGLVGAGIALLKDRGRLKGAVLAPLVGLAIAAPWYVRNVVATGNPVYPFFHSVLGGRGWTPFYAEIYSHEQQTFGMGRPDLVTAPRADYVAAPLRPDRLPHAVAGLAAVPGRYVNPNPTGGDGFVFGATGFAIFLGALAWIASGRIRRFEGALLLGAGLSLGLWFFLSEQSRYILALAPPLAILAGGAVATLGARWLTVAVAAQAAITLFVHGHLLASDQIKAFGDREAWRAARTPFARVAPRLNEVVPETGGVALFDEVFGFLLDRKYVWANPGHTSTTGWETMETGADLADRLRALGMTHAYLNLGLTPASDPATARWIAAMGLNAPPEPFTAEERAERWPDLRNRWKVLFAEAVAAGRLRPVESVGRGIVFEVRP